MITKYYSWHKIEVYCENPEHSTIIKDATVEVRDGICTIRAADNNHVYGHAIIEWLSPYDMNISAEWFSSSYLGNGDVTTVFYPVKIICIYEDRE